MVRGIKLDASTARRARGLGDIGEQLAATLLARAGFTNVRNLNHAAVNFPYGDFCAERSGERYVISVKMRNRYEARTGRLNSRYKLGARCYELALRAEQQLNAKAAWLAIALEPTVFSAYFGRLEQLRGSRGIAMTPLAVEGYECLANSEAHVLDYAALKNTYEPVQSER